MARLSLGNISSIREPARPYSVEVANPFTGLPERHWFGRRKSVRAKKEKTTKTKKPSLLDGWE